MRRTSALSLNSVYSLGHLALETANLEQIATEFILVWLVSIYSVVPQKKNLKKFTWGNMLKF